jgi:hypothetical protein
MRGMDDMQDAKPLLTTLKLKDFVPADHPLRPVQLVVNEALKRLNGLFKTIYADSGDASIAPEKLLRAKRDEVAARPFFHKAINQSGVPETLPWRSDWASNLLIHPAMSAFPEGSQVDLRIAHFEACSAFARITACALTLSPICDTHHRRLQLSSYLHSCSCCFRLERCRVGLALGGKRHLCTANGHYGRWPSFLTDMRTSALHKLTDLRAPILSSASLAEAGVHPAISPDADEGPRSEKSNAHSRPIHRGP